MLELTKARFIPEDKFPIKAYTYIFDNTVALASLEGKIVGVIIESEEIAKSMRSFFNLAWEAAEKYNE